MKKAIKYILLGVLSLALIGGGYIFYELKIKKYDVADEKVDELVKESIELELPNGSKLKLDAEGNVIEEIAAPKVDKKQYELDEEGIVVEAVDGQVTAVYNKNHEVIEHETIKVGTAFDQETTKVTEVKPIPEAKPTVESIKAKYVGSFAALEGQAHSRLGGLIGQAKAEYSTKVSNGESINYSYFYQKYYGAATGMEASIDGAFEALYEKLQQELTANGYDSANASSFRTQYESAKSSLRSELMSSIK